MRIFLLFLGMVIYVVGAVSLTLALCTIGRVFDEKLVRWDAVLVMISIANVLVAPCCT